MLRVRVSRELPQTNNNFIDYIYSGDEILKMLVTIVGQEMMKIQGR